METKAHNLYINRANNELANTAWAANSALKAYYRFTAGSLLVDSSAYNHPLTNLNSATEVAGKFNGGAAMASASTQGFSIVNHADLRPTGNYTIGAWIKTSTTGAEQTIFQSQYLTGGTRIAGIIFRIRTDNRVYLQHGTDINETKGSGWEEPVGYIPVCDGLWHFVVGTYDGSNLKIYVDGNFDTSLPFTLGAGYNASNLVRIGQRNVNGTPDRLFNGSVDDLFLLNGVALNDSQIRDIYGSGMKAYYRLENNLTDESGKGNSLTAVGSPGYVAGKFGNAVDLESGSSQHGYINDANQVELGVSRYVSVSCWIKIESLPSELVTNPAIFGKYDLNNQRGWLFYTPNPYDSLRFQWNPDKTSATTASIMTTNPFFETGDKGNWVHAVGTLDAVLNVAKFYKNGVLQASDPLSGAGTAPIPFVTAPVGLGARYNSVTPVWGEFFDGVIEDLAVFNKVLSQDEVTELYNIKAWTKSLTDTETLSETITKASVKTKLETATLSELFTKASTRSLTETALTISDTVDYLKAKGLEFADNILTSDIFTRLWNTSRQFADGVGLTDVISSTATRLRAFVDTVTASDLYTKLWAMHRDFSDSFHLFDTIRKFLNGNRIITYLYQVKNTVFSNKYTAKGTVYTNKYEKKNTDY